MIVHRVVASTLIFGSALFGLSGSTPHAEAFVDSSSRDWAQFTTTTGLSWNQTASVCPQDGATPCLGSVGGRNLSGWIWATEPQVRALFAQRYSSAFLTSDVADGWFLGVAFVNDFGVTGYVTTTYSNDEWAYGWTASKNSTGEPIGVGGDWGHPFFHGGVGIGAVSSADTVSQYRGVVLWRPSAAAANAIVANDDSATATTSGGVAVSNALSNDSLGGVPVSLSNVAVVQNSATAGLSLDVSDGSVDVAPGTVAGSKTLVYTICELALLTNCDSATVTVTVNNLAIDARDDAGSVLASAGGAAVANVLSNDIVDGAVATWATVSIASISASPGLTLDTADGSVDVAVGTTGGVKTLAYRICEIAQPTNCDTATVVVVVSAQSIIVSSSELTIAEGQSSLITVRLGLQPSSNVVVAVTPGIGTTTIVRSPSSITFTPSNWNMPKTLTFTTKQDSNKFDNAITVNLTTAGVPTATVAVTVADDDRPSTTPHAIFDTPRNGQTLSAMAYYRATATDVGGSLDEAKYYVDGARVWTGNVGGTFWWNTASVVNGVHTLEIRVSDTDGNEGRSNIKIYVSN